MLNSECVLSAIVCVPSSVSFCVKIHMEMENVQFYAQKNLKHILSFSQRFHSVLACL